MVDTVEKAIYALGVTGLDQLDRADQALGRVAVTEERVTKATRTTTDGLERMIARLDQRVAAERRLQASLDQIARYEQENIGTATRRAQAIDLVTQRYNQQIATLNKATVAHNDNTRSMGQATVSANAQRYAMLNLSNQLQDVFVGLTSGQRPMTVLIQQGSQLSTVFGPGTGGVSGVLGAAGRAIVGMISPTTLAVAGFATLAIGIGVVIARAVELERQTRTLGVTLRAMGTGGLASSADLQRQVEQLRATGTPTTEGLAAVQDIIRTSGLNPAAAGRIATTGRDIGTILGGDIAIGTKTLVGALSGGVEDMVRLGHLINAFKDDPGLPTLARRMAEVGQTAEAVDRIFNKIAQTTSGAFPNSLGPSQRAMIELRESWNKTLDALARSDVFQSVLASLKNIADEMTRIISNGPAFRAALIGGGAGAVAGAVGGGIAGSAVAGPWGAIPGAILGGIAGAATGWDAGGTVGTRPEHGAVVARATIPPVGGVAAGTVPGSSGLAPEFASSLQQMIADAAANGIVIGIGSGLRTTERQAQLYAQDLAAHGGRPSGMVARPGSSMHEYGAAADLVDASGRTIRAGSPEAAYLAANSSRYGLVRPMSYEPWHIEPAGARAGTASVTDPTAIDRSTAAYKELTIARERDLAAIREVGLRSEILKATQEALRENNDRQLVGEQALANIRDHQAQAIARMEAERKKSITAGELEISNTRDLVEAYSQSAQAGELAAQRAKAVTETYQRLGEVSSETAKRFISERTQQLQVAEQFSLRQRFVEANVQDVQQIQVLRLQASLQGQSSEEINRQVSLLRVSLDAQAKGLDVTDKTVQARLRVVDAVGRENEAYAEAVRQNQRLEEMVRSIASTIENALTSAVESAFSGQRITDWGARIRSMLSSALSSLTATLFIRPALGSIAGGLGFGNVASQLGTFGGGGLFGGSSGALGNASSVASLGNSSGLFGNGGMFGGVGNWFNGIGSSLGFATPTVALSESSIASISNLIGIEQSSLGFLGNAGSIGGSGLFGAASLGSVLGGAGAGLGAGMLLNGLIGGNQLGGGIGSGVGSIAGALAGAALIPILGPFGPMIGGLLGGSGGGLFGGMFGNSKPSNASAGGAFNLGTGKITGGFSGGDPAIDQAAQQAAQSLGDIISILKTIPGNTLGGQLLLQNGKNTGLTIDWANLTGVEGYGEAGRMSLGRDPAQAAQMVGLALARGLTGVSDTVSKIIAQTTDLSQLAENLSFAPIYDRITEQFEDAFKSLPNETQAGQFEQAMDQGSAAFDQLIAKSQQFGLAVEPVYGAFDEFKKRLGLDFIKSVDTAFNSATGNDFLNQIQAISDAYAASTRESGALGLTDVVGDKLGQIYAAQINAALKELTPAQIDEVSASFGNLYGVLDSLTAAAREAAAATGTFLLPLRALHDSLTAGPLSGATPAAQLAAANDNYAKSLAAAQANGSAETYSALAAAGNALIALSHQMYGNAPQTAATRATVLADIDPILGFAAGTMATPPGTILVGERGPELIEQRGGLRVWNNPDTERMLSIWPGRHFANGTVGWAANSNGWSDPEIKALLREVSRKLDAVIRIGQAHGAVSEEWLPRIGESAGNKPVVLTPPERRRA